MIRVAIAAETQFVCQKLAALFQSKSGIRVELIPGSSGNSTASIDHGAPYDVFLSADMGFPDSLFEKGFTMERPRIYAYGKLVLWTLKRQALSRGIQAVLDPSFHTIALANPKTAP